MKTLRIISFILIAAVASVALASPKGKRTEARTLTAVEIPDLKTAEVCIANTVEVSDEKLEWLLTCLDKNRKFIFREKRIANEKVGGDNEMSYGDLEMAVEFQNRGFRLVTTQDGLFFTRK